MLFNTNQNKAQAHIEMILAFVLFISMITIFFIIFKPISNPSELPIQDTQQKILNNLSEKIGKLSAIVKTNNDCYSLTDVNIDYGNNFVEIQDTSNPRRYFIYYHPTFTQSTISCTSRPNQDYQLGTYSEEELILKNNIINLKQDYETNYKNLITSLNLKTHFSFSFMNLDRIIIPELTPIQKSHPEGLNIISNEFPIRIIDSNGNIQELILNIKIW